MSGRITCLDAVAGDPRFIWVGSAGGGVWKSRDGGVTFEAGVRRPLAVDRRAGHRPGPARHGLGGHRRILGAQQRRRGRRRLPHRRRRRQVAAPGSEGSERIAEILIHPARPERRLRGGDGSAVGPRRRSAGCSARATAAPPGRRSCTSTTPPAASTSRWIRPTRTRRVRGDVAVPALAGLLHLGRAGQRALQEHRRRRHLARSWSRGCRRANWAASRSRSCPRSRPTVYAVVEAERTAFFRSDDRGETWTRTTDNRAVGGRPFYFSLLVPDPRDAERVYKAGTNLLVTRDGGVTFGGVGGWVHSDIHALWINPNDPNHMIVGTDGGVYLTHNQGSGWCPRRRTCRSRSSTTWRSTTAARSTSTAACRTTARGRGRRDRPAASRTRTGRTWAAATASPWCPTAPTPTWSTGSGRAATCSGWTVRTGDSKDIKPQPGPGDPEFRFNWNTPIVTSPGDGRRLYVGSQFLHRSTDRGDTWKRLSGDLTTNDPARQRQEQSGGLTVDNTTAENHCTIFSISESPRDRKVIWVGTDDGNLQVTGDDGAHWANVGGEPARRAAGHLDQLRVEPRRTTGAQRSSPPTATAAGDMTPYVLATDDLGATWRSLVTPDRGGPRPRGPAGSGQPRPALPGHRDGPVLTLDRGRHWARFAEEFPHGAGLRPGRARARRRARHRHARPRHLGDRRPDAAAASDGRHPRRRRCRCCRRGRRCCASRRASSSSRATRTMWPPIPNPTPASSTTWPSVTCSAP